MLIKLESGDYINTDGLTVLYKLVDSDGYRAYCGVNQVDVTPADRDRLVEAMGEKTSGEYGEVIRWNIAGNPYEIDLYGKTYTLTEVD